MLSWFSSSGYSQSASLLAHNGITAPESIRKSLHFSWYKQILTHCLLLFATLQGTYLIQLNITAHKSHIREQARYAGRFSRPPSSIGSVLNSRYSRIHRPINNVSHTTTYAPKSVPGKGEREGEKRASQLWVLSPSQISAGKTIPGSPTLYHSGIRIFTH